MKPKLSQYFILPVMKFELASSHHWNNVKSLIIESLEKNFTTLYWNFSINRTTTWRVLIRPTERPSIGLPPCGPHPQSIERPGTIDSRACGSSTTADPVRSTADEWATLSGTESNKDLFIVRGKACWALVKEWAVARVSLNVHVFPCGSYMYVYWGIYFIDLKYAFMECLPWCAILMYSVNVDWWAKTV